MGNLETSEGSIISLHVYDVTIIFFTFTTLSAE
jgi:hypothetical protein